MLNDREPELVNDISSAMREQSFLCEENNYMYNDISSLNLMEMASKIHTNNRYLQPF